MNKKIIITLVAVLAVLTIVSISIASGENSILICENTEIEAGADAEFSIDLSNVDEEEYGEYNLNVSVEPADSRIFLNIPENISAKINNTRGVCEISYDALSFYDTLHFVMKTDASIENEHPYKVKVDIIGEKGSKSEEIELLVVPKKETTESETNASTETSKTKKTSDKSNEGDDDKNPEDGDTENIYEGSSDNYLNSLSVDGYKLEQKFHKTRDTYFVKTSEMVKSLNVNATACAKTAKIDIIGNNNIAGNMSKILINVTAQNGDLRVYRIYVIQER